jgi:hypothetical protein
MLNFSQIPSGKLNHGLCLCRSESCLLHGGAPKANGPRISVDSFIIIIRPFYLLLPPLFLFLAHTRTPVSSGAFLLFPLFCFPPPLPFELHRFSNISQSRHHCGHQSRERLAGSRNGMHFKFKMPTSPDSFSLNLSIHFPNLTYTIARFLYI